MKRKYHPWTGAEIRKVREYVAKREHPSSLYEIHALAEELGLSDQQVRGAVVREMKRQRDLREE